MTAKLLNLSNIQGNILAGFNKDYQDFLFLKFTTPSGGRAWIHELLNPDFDAGIAASTSENLLKFNAQFKALRIKGVEKPEEIISAQWTNLALSFRGLQALGISPAELDEFPDAFREGMKARNKLIGDIDTSDPSGWQPPFNSDAVHAIVLVAADTEADLKKRVEAITNSPAFKAGVTLLDKVVEGRTRKEQPGHEHFGFKDGISQPGIRGINLPDDPLGNPNQGHPGQDLLWPGEFVLGYPTQIPHAKTGRDGLNTDPGPISQSGPMWTADGSYLVFRRLEQDVPEFHKQVKALSVANNLHEDLMGAKLVGRFKSGCPLETPEYQKPLTGDPRTIKDPGDTRKELQNSDTLNNNFEFGDDPDGAICPLAAHIRKAYPRDGAILSNGENNESAVQTHRLLRRGIPFGSSYDENKKGIKDEPRGLLFLAYQRDIQNQFEFVQRFWINDPEFPKNPKGVIPGQDPIIAQTTNGTFQLDPTKPHITVNHFVKTTGGEYFFAPSIETLTKIGGNEL